MRRLDAYAALAMMEQVSAFVIPGRTERCEPGNLEVEFSFTSRFRVQLCGLPRNDKRGAGPLVRPGMTASESRNQLDRMREEKQRVAVLTPI
jgi:hypothetical protein